MKKKRFLPLILSIFALALTSCDFFLGEQSTAGGGKGYTRTWESTNNGEHPNKVTLSCDNLHSSNSLSVGESMRLVSNVTPLTCLDKTLWFETSDSDVASVDSSGYVTARSKGNVTITAHTVDGNKTSKISLNITDSGVSALDFTDWVEETKSTCYQTNFEINGDYGLSEPNNIGPSQNSLETVIYPIPDDEDFTKTSIINIDELTINDLSKVLSGVDLSDDYYRIKGAFLIAKEYASSGAAVKLVMNKDEYHIKGTHAETGNYVINLDGLENVYLEGNNATITIDTISGQYRGFFNFTNCLNVHVNNIKCRLDVPDFICGKIVNYDAETRTVSVQYEESQYGVVASRLVQNSLPNILTYAELDQETKLLASQSNTYADTDYVGSYTVDLNNKIINYTFRTDYYPNRPTIGDIAVMCFTMYGATGIHATGCENLYFDGVTITNASGMAMIMEKTHNLYVNRLIITPEHDYDYVSSIADGLHIASCTGTVEITNCLIERNWDDAFNVKGGVYYDVSSVNSATNTIVASQSTESMDMPNVGDKIAIYSTVGFNSYNPKAGYYTIKSISTNGSSYVIKVNESLKNNNADTWGEAKVSFLSATPDELIFRNNIVRNKRRHALLAQVPKVIIENNCFTNVAFGSLSIGSVLNHHNEATVPLDITINNNKFINNNTIMKDDALRGDVFIAVRDKTSQTYGPSNIINSVSVENNFFTANYNAACAIHSSKSVELKNNCFYKISNDQRYEDFFNSALYTENCADVYLEDNYMNETDAVDGVVYYGTTEENMIYIDDTNQNINIRGGSLEKYKTYEVNKMAGQISIDGDLSDWDNITPHEIEINAISGEDSNRHSADDLSDHWAIKHLYMSYDDNGIYLAFSVYDDEVTSNDKAFFYKNDFFEIITTSTLDEESYDDIDLQYIKDNNDVSSLQIACNPSFNDGGTTYVCAVRTSSDVLTLANSVKSNVIMTNDGYQGELFIPFSMIPSFKENIDNNLPICMAVTVGDNERSDLGLSRMYASNVPHYVDYNKLMIHKMPRYYFI